MNIDLNDENRPSLQPAADPPPEWWEYQRAKEKEKKDQEKVDSEKRVIIIDI